MSAPAERIDAIVSLTRASREDVKPTMDKRRFIVDGTEYFSITDAERDEIGVSYFKGRFRWLGQVGLHVYQRS